MWATYRPLRNEPTDFPRNRPDWPRGRLGVQLALGGLVVLTLGAAAISASPAPFAIPAPKLYGAAGQRFDMSFLTAPSTCLSEGSVV